MCGRRFGSALCAGQVHTPLPPVAEEVNLRGARLLGPRGARGLHIPLCRSALWMCLRCREDGQGHGARDSDSRSGLRQQRHGVAVTRGLVSWQATAMELDGGLGDDGAKLEEQDAHGGGLLDGSVGGEGRHMHQSWQTTCTVVTCFQNHVYVFTALAGRASACSLQYAEHGSRRLRVERQTSACRHP